MTKILTIIALTVFASAQVVQESVPQLDPIDVEEHLGELVPGNIRVTDEQGVEKQLADYFGKGKPVLLTLAYYNCPMLCTFVLNGLVQGMQQIPWQAGEQFEVLTVSIDPTENAELAANKKQVYLSTLNRPGAEKGWTFATSDQANITRLAEAVGFKYYYDEEMKQYAHPAVSYVLTDNGKISRYLYGIEYKPKDLRLALLEAGEGKVGTTLDKLILFCYHYDPDSRGYVLFASNVMKIGGVLTLIVLATFLLVFWRRERRKRLRLELKYEQIARN